MHRGGVASFNIQVNKLVYISKFTGINRSCVTILCIRRNSRYQDKHRSIFGWISDTTAEKEKVSTTNSTEMTELGDDQNIQMDERGGEGDDILALRREKRLRAMCYCSILTIFVSIFAIVVGILAILNSNGKFPYSMGGGAIAGGMAIFLTICPFCMYKKGRRTKTGNNLSGLLMFNVFCLIIWYCLCLCAILIAIGMSGIWGMVECNREKPGERCKKETSEKLTFSVLTFILSALLLILANVIICLLYYYTKALGIKTARQRNYESYRYINRANIQREMIEERSNENRDTARGLGGYNSNTIDNSEENRRERHDSLTEHERDHPIKPSAPPLGDNPSNRDSRIQEDRRPPRGIIQGIDHFVRPMEDRFRSPISHENRHSPSRLEEDTHQPRTADKDVHRSERINSDNLNLNQHDSNKPRVDYSQASRYVDSGDKQNQSESALPSYEEVVNKYVKADDV
ncbi:uncharacterized protein LOC132747405 [Ruditapes philippinarum]|uniref:uncharacterized protein LOC132747405 n=1 Tax=Ruditapes philippinarum TaxID=129788 RepID=UPI00295AC361|nr:uncharacterized protein LOC132747405 [Ruditapes philippinarum]